MASNVRFIDALKVGQFKGNKGDQGPTGSGFPFTGSARITGSLDLTGSLAVDGNITASGNISASGDIFARNLSSSGNFSSSGDLEIRNLTASGNISASGFVQSNQINSNQITGSTLAIGTDYNSLPNDPGYTGIISRFDGGVFFNIKQEALKTFGINNAAVGDSILQIDTEPNHFLLDPTGGNELKVGLGVVSPSASLDIVGNIQASSHITASGNISASGTGSFEGGIRIGGTTETTTEIVDSFGEKILFAENDLTVCHKHINAGFGIFARSAATGRQMGIDGSSTCMGLYTAGQEKVSITQVGNMGIGTTSPNEKLQVEGNISASGNLILQGHITSSGHLSSSGDLEIRNLTASSNISASGNIIGASITSSGNFLAGAGGVYTSLGSSTRIGKTGTDSNLITIEDGGDTLIENTVGGVQLTDNNNAKIEVGSGEISFDTSGSCLALKLTKGNITASGNISASGEGRFETLGINFDGSLSTGSATNQVALRVDGNTRIDRGYFLVINSSSLNEYLYYKNENKSLYIATTSSNTPIDPQLSLVQDGLVKAGFGWDDEIDQQSTFISNFTLFTASLSPSSSLGGIGLATSGSDGTIDRLKVTQLGNVGIGTTTPGEKLVVSGNISASGDIIGKNFTGSSFTGSFFGDGFGLTNLNSGSWDGIFTGSARITGSLDLTGSLEASGSTHAITGLITFGGVNETSLSAGSGLKSLSLNVADSNDSNNPDNYLISLDNSGDGVFYAKSLELGDGEAVSSGSVFKVDSANGKFLFTAGNVGIGNSFPPEKLTVAGNISASGDLIGRNITASGNISASGQFIGDGTGLTGVVLGTGVANFIPQFTNANTIQTASQFCMGSNVVQFGTSLTDDTARSICVKAQCYAAFTVQNEDNAYAFGTRPGGAFAFTNVNGNQFPFQLACNACSSAFFIGGGNGGRNIAFATHGSCGNLSMGWTNTYTTPARFTLMGHSTTDIIRVYDSSSAANQLMTFDYQGNLGIGTTSPTEKLQVQGNISASGTGSFSDGRFTGNVGIGTTAPSTLLQLSGSGGNSSGLSFTNGSGEFLRQYFQDENADSSFLITYDGTGGAEITLQHDGDIILNGTNGDNVGIGTSTPNGKLGVSGSVNVLGPNGHITASGNISAGGTGSFSDGRFTGNVGLNTTAPGEMITVRGCCNFIAAEHPSYEWGGTTPLGIRMGVAQGAGTNCTATSGVIDFFRWQGSSTNFIVARIGQNVQHSGNSYGLNFMVDSVSTCTTASTSRLYLAPTGNVGIGTTTPSASLDVVGNIQASSHITASGNISASGDITLDNVLTFGGSSNSITTSDTSANLSINPGGLLNLGTLSTDRTCIGRTGNASYQTRFFGGTTDEVARVSSGSFKAFAPITASSNISASGDLEIRNITASSNFLGTSILLSSGSGNTYPTPSTDANLLVLENKNSAGKSGLTIFSDNGATGNIYFGDEQSNQVAGITADNTSGNTDLFFTTNGNNERLRINGSGNVGIGTTNPQELLTLDDGNDSRLLFSLPSAFYGAINVRNDNNNASRNLILQNQGGNVGIGLTTPSSSLHISGSTSNNRLLQVGDNYLVVTGSNGKIGAGTLSPEAELHIKVPAGTSPEVRVEGAGNVDSILRLKNAQGNWRIFRESSTGDLVFKDHNNKEPLKLKNEHITASGNISASGTVLTKFIRLPEVGASSAAQGSIYFGIGPDDTNGYIYGETGTNLTLGFDTVDTVQINDKGINVNGQITASGNISASGTIIGSLVPQVPKVEYFTVTSSTLVENTEMALPNSLTYITSSGNYEYLEIFSDGVRLARDVNYTELNTGSVRYLTPIPSQSLITYKSLRLI